MLKFLIYSFLFYLIFRYLFGGAFGARVYNINQHHHYHNPPKDSEEEGRVTIDPKVSQKQSKGKTDKLGEYVDFEEVKE